MARDEISWKRISAEGIAIGASILVAFWVDTAWDQLQERRAERELLSVLQRELDEARGQLEIQLEVYGYLERATETTAARLADARSDPVMIPDTLIAGLLLDMSYDPPTGAAATALSAGQLGLLSDLGLRTALAQWPAAIADGVEEQRSLWEVGDEQLAPLLAESTPSLKSAYERLSVYEATYAIVNDGDAGESPIAPSPALLNLLYHRLALIRSTRADLEGITLAHIDLLETLVEQSLR